MDAMGVELKFPGWFLTAVQGGPGIQFAVNGVKMGPV